jgi:methyl-accepting chemotaxis protein
VLAISQSNSESCRHISTSLQKTAEISQQLEQKVETFKVN